MTKKKRLDTLLVERGMAESCDVAQRLILAGRVEVEGVARPKAGMLLAEDAAIGTAADARYVSRGGLKLEAGLRAFSVDAAGRVCADIGASTGGFTDCFLQHGAVRVYAVDVGLSQLHERLRRDPRVTVLERANARQLQTGDFSEPPTLAAVDVSFISLRKVLAALASAVAPEAELIALVKPQFEATRVEVSRGKGIIRDPEIHGRILREVAAEAPSWGWQPLGLAASPIAGGSGNREYLLHARRSAPAGEEQAAALLDIDIDALVRVTLMGK